MGTWASGILGDDFARDVYDRYTALFDQDKADSEIVKILRKEFKGSLDDPDEGPLFWLALARAQWECGGVAGETMSKAEEIVGKGLGLERWAEAGKSELSLRKSVLTKFLTALKIPSTKVRKKLVPPLEPLFKIGDCLSIQLDDGTFGAGIITRHEKSPTISYFIVSIIDYHCDKIPDSEILNKLNWLTHQELKEQNPSNYPIVKFTVYNDGFKRSAKHYSVVGNVALPSVPEPVFLGVANWGNLWKKLPAKLLELKR